MKTALKIIVGLVGVVILGAVVCGLGMYIITNNYINNSFDIAAESLDLPAEEEALARGEHIAISWGCQDCHTANLGGQPMMEDPAMGYVYASNLTAGEGGVGAAYSTADWVRAIRLSRSSPST